MTSPTSTPEPGEHCPYCGTKMENCGAPIWEDYCPNTDCTGHRDEFLRQVKAATVLPKDRISSLEASLSARDARIAELEGERDEWRKECEKLSTAWAENRTRNTRAEAVEKAVAGLVRQVAKGQDRIEAMADALAAAERKVGEMREAINKALAIHHADEGGDDATD
jgi:negative regulator of sigma E activity